MSTSTDLFAAYAAALEAAGRPTRPVGLLDLDAFDANAAEMRARMSAGAEHKPIRVASKSLRVRRALDRALSLPGYTGVLAFTVAEARWLVETGRDDVLIAYPTADREAVKAIAADDAARSAITFMADSPAHLQFLAAQTRLDRPLRICLELDSSFPLNSSLRMVPQVAKHFPGSLRVGALRSPLFQPQDLENLARRVVATPGLLLVGIMAYESQVAGLYNQGSSPRARMIRSMQKASRAEIAERRAEAVERVRRVARLEFVNGGGTGSIESTSAESAVTEVAAGSGFYAPGLFSRYTGFSPRPALHFVLDVVRRPGPDIVTVLGGGWVASGVPREDRLPDIAWPEGLAYAPEEAAGEVQTPLIGEAANHLALGDPVFFRHAKAGEVAERLNSLLVYSGGEIIDEWPTYRGEGKAFL
jgi:D-serine deaminase-like pyridoxal phosphate-dependent protein